MNEPSPVRRRSWWKLFLLFCGFAVMVVVLLAWYVTTDSFQQMVRRRVIAAMEEATGGRVEVGEFHTIPMKLRVDVRNLVIHGREGNDQVPFFHVDRLQAELKIVSFLSTKARLHSLLFDHPVTHLIVYPDGSTNAPAPRVSRSSGRGPVEDLVSLSVSHLEAHRGELLWEQNKIPLDFDAHDVSAVLHFSFLHQHYQAEVRIGGATTQWRQYPAVVWQGDASLVLARNHADISSLNLASGKSGVHFSGTVQDFHEPQISGSYRGDLDLAELATFLRQTVVRRGTAHFEGKGSWSLRDFSTQGTLTASQIDWSDGQLRTQNGRISAGYAVSPRRLQVSSIKANGFGGDLQGDVDVTNWQSSLESEARGKRQTAGRVPVESLQRGSIRLRLSGFPIAPGLAVVSTAKLPLDRLNLAGTVSGNLEMLWVGSIQDSEARANLTIAAPQQPQTGALPVRGQVAGIYRGSRDELELDEFRVNTPASEMDGSGNLSATSSLKFSFNSHDLREWKPLLEAAYGSASLPFTIHGWAKLDGAATGRVSALAFNGNVELYDFDTVLPVNRSELSRSVHWDALTAAVQYSKTGLVVHSGVLIHAHAIARFDGSMALSNGSVLPTSPFSLRLDLRNADLTEAAQLAGTHYPITGSADLSLRAVGTRVHPHAEGRLEIKGASVYSTPVASLRSGLVLADNELQFNNVDATVFGTPLSGSLALNLSNDQFQASLSGRNLDLAKLPQLRRSRVAVDGEADFSARAGGSWKSPSLDAHVHVRDLAFDKERAGDFYVDAVTTGHQIEIQAHSDFAQADLKIQGRVQAEGNLPADLDLTFNHLDVDALLNAYLSGKVTGHSTLAGTVRLHGPLRTPRELKVSASLDAVDAEIAHVHLVSAEPVRLEIADRMLRLESMHLSGNGTDFSAHGRAQLGDPGEMDFRLDGTVGVELLQSLNPKISARGVMGVSLTVLGTRSNPLLQGRLEVKDTYVSHNDFPSGLSGLNGVLTFNQNRIQIEKLDGTTGGGSIGLTGSATYEKGIVSMDIGARARNVRLRYPPGISSTASANLRLSGTTNSALLTGQIVVNKMGVTPGFDFGAYFEKSKRPPAAPGPENLASRLKLDVHVSTAPELQMQTAIAKLSGSADLRVRGTVDRPVVTGRVNANEGGQLSFNGTKYNVERFEVTFSNPAKTTPVIDIQASTRVRDYDVTVNISGDVTEPNALRPTWHSEPPLPEADVIALLALGRTREESASQAGGSSALGGEFSNLVLNEALNTAVTSRMQRLFGVSRIKIDPQGLSSETNVVRGPQVTIEQQVASNLTITYSTNVSVASQQIIQAEYNVTRNISIVALRDQNGVVSFDVKIRQRKK
ncbi:MAG TPA: translocation/assembly module TamB domain-containing protein [Terriglobales bacterium]|nr:translocation/assembly module TamB domain-containing protein [Terriglobales bacterium]